MSASLDGFDGDLNSLYPGYFKAGWEYQLYIASYNCDPEVCVAWTPEIITFEVVNCCAPNVVFETPECVAQGEPFTVQATLEAPLTPDQIQLIYSYYPNYDYISHTATPTDSSLQLDIVFVSNTCTCDGELLVFDIILAGCPGTIWVMTEDLPCCLSECEGAQVVNWHTSDCILYNGQLARTFCLSVSSPNIIEEVLAGTNSVTCQVDLAELEILSIQTDGTHTICGVMIFQDASCTGHALVSLVLRFREVCCTIERGFSFPGSCDVGEECMAANPDPQLVLESALHLALNLPVGSTVTVIDRTNGAVYTPTVGSIFCVSEDIFGFEDCNGIKLPVPTDLNCLDHHGEDPKFLYQFEIRWGDCVWLVSGDYCDGLPIYTGNPFEWGLRSSAVEENNRKVVDGINVFPNPITGSSSLYIDIRGVEVVEISLMNINGQLIGTILPAEEESIFQYHLDRSIPTGIYLMMFRLEDGSVRSQRLVVNN
ncbi:MAG: T9SS type A sorting domain-containing protein [Bacteroidota bacterium]